MDQQINQLTPQQRQAVLMRAQQEANQQIMQDMIQRMVKTCFNKCAGTSVRFLVRVSNHIFPQDKSNRYFGPLRTLFFREIG